MAKVVLKSLEGGPQAVVIPTGKTVIGRGPLLGCGDKKVSRKHAVLEVTESGEIYLTPIHVNPCFYQPPLEKTAKVLKKDTAQKLEPGDTFSLLPRAFRYQVAMDDCQKNEEQENKVQNNKESEPNKENIVEGSKVEVEEKFIEDTEAEKGEAEKGADSAEGESEDDDAENDSNAIKQEPNATQLNGEKLCTENSAPVDNSVVHSETVKEELKPTPTVPESQQNTNHNEEKLPERKPVVRKRTLPEWLIQCAASPPPAQSTEQQKVTKRKNATTTSAVSTGTKPKKQTSKRHTYSDSESEKEVRRPSKARSSRQNRQTRQGISLEDFIVSDDDEWESDESRNQRSRRKRGQKRDDDSGSDWEAEQRKKRRSSYRVDSGSDSASDWETENRKKRMSKKPTRRGKARYTKDVSDDDDDDEPPASAKKGRRRPCKYGKECYRRKPSHFEEFSHPGDSDYNSEAETNHSDEEEEDDGEDSRPECPFGIDCYRKNVKHKKDYKHTKKVRPKREAARKAGKRHGDDDEEDSNMNDIDEEESDIYDPQESASDWEPEADSDGDDVKRLLKEPKGFVQNKMQKQV